MPTTPIYALPYPLATDPADVPLDMQELAGAVEAALVTGRPATCLLSPVNGQIVRYLVSANGPIWSFVYVAASAAPYRWHTLGDQVGLRFHTTTPATNIGTSSSIAGHRGRCRWPATTASRSAWANDAATAILIYAVDAGQPPRRCRARHRQRHLRRRSRPTDRRPRWRPGHADAPGRVLTGRAMREHYFLAAPLRVSTKDLPMPDLIPRPSAGYVISETPAVRCTAAPRARRGRIGPRRLRPRGHAGRDDPRRRDRAAGTRRGRAGRTAA